jgi:hypothetical protein
MSGSSGKPVRLYAVVPAGEGFASGEMMRDVRMVDCGSVAALAGEVCGQERDAAAIRHDDIVRLAVERHSSVVPFRFGTELCSISGLRSLLEIHYQTLSDQLRRFCGRLEMGLKARLTPKTSSDVQLPGLPFGLERIRALAPRSSDRQEKLGTGWGGTVFEGCYLIGRDDIDRFWDALEHIRSAVPELALLGSGPWAPYSFCDFTLGSGRQGETGLGDVTNG